MTTTLTLVRRANCRRWDMTSEIKELFDNHAPASEILEKVPQEIIEKVKVQYGENPDPTRYVSQSDIYRMYPGEVGNPKAWVKRKKLKPILHIGTYRIPLYSRDEVIDTYLNTRTKKERPEHLKPIFQESDHDYRIGETHGIGVRDLFFKFEQTKKQTFLWRAIERLAKHSLRKKGIERGDQRWEDGFSEIFLTLCLAYAKCNRKDSGDYMFRYLSRTARAHFLGNGERIHRRQIKKYFDKNRSSVPTMD